MIETLYEDKRRLEKEVSTYKDLHASKSAKISSLGDSFKLQKTVQEKIDIIKQKDEEISSIQGQVLLKEDRIAALEYELNLAYRAISIQNRFEQHSNLPSSLGTDRETLRTLYFSVAKSQAESQSMSKALAEKDRECLALKDANEKLLTKVTILEHDNKHLEDRLESESSLARSSQEEITQLTAALAHLKEERDDLEYDYKRMEIDLKGKLDSLDELCTLQKEDIRGLHQQISQDEETLSAAKDRISILESALDQLHFNMEETKRQFEVEKTQLRNELKAAEQTIGSLRQVEQENLSLQGQISQLAQDLQASMQSMETVNAELSHTREEMNLFNYQLVAERAHGANLQSQISQLEGSLAIVCRERDEVVGALKQSMEITKDLMKKLALVQEEKAVVERKLDEEVALRKKVSLVMLGALQKQSEQSAAEDMEKSMRVAAPRLPVLEDFSWMEDFKKVQEAFALATACPPPPPSADTASSAALCEEAKESVDLLGLAPMTPSIDREIQQ